MKNVISEIQEGLCSLGIRKGDTLLMHSSYKSLGEFEGGAKTFFDAIISYLGEDGTLLLPAFSYDSVNFENPVFKERETPSCTGYLSEYFRTKVPGVKRSVHATHSVCALGKHAEELTKNHKLDKTPVGKNSPITKLRDYSGKILFLGCSPDRNTSIHGVEELCEPPYLLDRENKITYRLVDNQASVTMRESYRHDFHKDGYDYVQKYSRICDLLTDGEIKRGFILKAECVAMDANAVWSKGLEALMRDPYFFVDKVKAER